jgi:energy-coupling factor transporter transmembrane protein EcfT
MFKVNTKTQLITFFLFALLVNNWHLTILLILMPFLLMILIYTGNRHYFQLSYRLKWFYLVMFVIYALSTPGEHVAGWALSITPTYEGLSRGLEQILRIATMLALLSMILTQHTKQQLISAIYFLMRPLSYLGLDIERFSTRLWLTLHYVELQRSDVRKTSLKGGLSQYLNRAVVDVEDEDIAIVLESQKQNVMDYIVLSIMCVILIIVYFGWAG